MFDVPEPGPDARAASAALAERLRADIAARGGWIGFDRFMELALYTPGLGYYSGGSTKLGRAGDFVTAPELGGFLARALASLIGPVLERECAPTVLELGAGSGALAEQLVAALARVAGLKYLILEPSAELRQRQQARLAAAGPRVEWLDALPARPFDGVVVANEVADALPVARFVKRGGRVLPLGVTLGRDAGFEWAEGEPEPRTTDAVAGIERALGAPLPDGYRSEWCPALGAWIEALAAALETGAVALIDYGLVRREYYHPERADGTLICHYRHRAHADPFVYPGLQDITAWVDFSAAAAAAARAGLDVAGFTTQSLFVVQALAGLDENPVADASPAELAALKTLVLPGEMGERFKVLWLTRGIDGGAPLPGRDLRARL